MTAIEMLYGGDRWTDQTARLMLPILAERALAGETIGYGEIDVLLAQQAGRPHVFARAYNHPAGKVGDIIALAAKELRERIPPLNLILVNKLTGVPGSGANYYLEQFVSPGRRSKRNAEQIKSLKKAAIEKVKNYPRWERVLEHLGLELPRASEKPDNTPIDAPPSGTGGGGPEGEAHRSLKEWVAKHPNVFKSYGAVRRGKVEQLLESGDRIDVLFVDDRTWLGVEVKATGCSEYEHWRGVFQCVKYRATLRAIRTLKAEIPNVRVLLVVESEPSSRVKAAAERLDVEWMNVSQLR